MSDRSGSRWMVALVGLLVALLCWLAVLQLRWIDALSAAERERLANFVSTGVERTLFDLERGLAESEKAFRDVSASTPDELERNLRAVASAQLGQPQGARRIESLLWISAATPGAPKRLRPGEAAWEEIGWTTELAAWERVARALFEPGAGRVLTLPPDPPGRLVPLLGVADAARGPHFVLLLFDDAGLHAMLDELVRKHLGQAFGPPVEVLITHAGEPRYRSHEALDHDHFVAADARRRSNAGRIELGRADGAQRLVRVSEEGEDGFAVREVELQATGEPGPAQPPGEPLVIELPDWEVSARHSAGSVEIAVAKARRRNLMLGFGTLTVLVLAGVTLTLAARRARLLERRQVEFLAGVTHELRTPLTVISSAGENLRDLVVSGRDQTRHYGQLIYDEARRLSELVEQALLLAGARGSAPRKPTSPVELSDLLPRIAERCRATAGAAAPEIVLDVPGDLPAVAADAGALEQALTNLLGNAIKYGAPGPEVGVRVSSPQPDRVDVTVWDRGPGISDAERDRLFEPFFRGATARESQLPGSGLGLSVVRSVVQGMGGSVTVRSEPGAGSAFVVSLPVVES